jgi:hypothetical protein
MSLIFKEGLISVDLILVTSHVFKERAWKYEQNSEISDFIKQKIKIHN